MMANGWMARLGFALFVGALAAGGCSVESSSLCTNTCGTANDAECDDGGPDSLFSICALGTDCNDCGQRFCTNTCEDADDGFCDDGGPGASFSICEFGSDCNDCGVR